MSRKGFVSVAIALSCAASSLYVYGGSCGDNRPVSRAQKRMDERLDPDRPGRGPARTERDRAPRNHGQWIQVTARQREQVRTCTRATDLVRSLAREMGRAAKGSRFSVAAVRRRQARLSESILRLRREHQRFAGGLADAQREQLGDRIRQMERCGERLDAHLEELARVLAGATPDSRLVADRAREVEREARMWQKQYRFIARMMIEGPDPVAARR
ncbi:MAG: hypothetical protein ACE5JH_05055 [Acidobacteriota bacterium]